MLCLTEIIIFTHDRNESSKGIESIWSFRLRFKLILDYKMHIFCIAGETLKFEEKSK